MPVFVIGGSSPLQSQEFPFSLDGTYLRLDTTNDPLLADLDMNGQKLIDWAGSTSSNAVLLSLVANVATSAGVVGIEHRWAPGTVETVNTYIQKWSYDDGSNVFDMARLGFGRSATTGILWLVDKDEDANSAINDWTIIAGDSNNEASAGTCAIQFFPNALSGAIDLMAGGERALRIRKSGNKVALAAGWFLASDVAFLMRAVTQDDNNGTYQFGTEDTTQATTGWFQTWTDKIVAGVGANASYRIASIRWDGGLFSGRSGNDLIIPADGFIGAHGWVRTSTADNQAGVDLNVIGGAGTGDLSGDLTKGAIHFQTHDQGSSGTAISSATDKMILSRAGDLQVNGAVEVDGDLNHDGSGVGFYGTAPVAQSSAYTPTNDSTDRSFDANATSVDELADVLATLITDLQATGLIG